MSFGTMPHSWIEGGQLRLLSARGGVLGRSIAALKSYLAIAAYRDWDTGCCVLSAYDLTKICGLSKPMVLEGIAMLSVMDLVVVEARAAGNVNRYSLPDFDENAFRKVPQDRVVDCLPRIGNRASRNLDALRLYLTMLYLRDGPTSKAAVSHTGLIHYTGTRPEDVAAANGVLAAAGLIHIRTSDDWSRTGHPTNEYELLGDFKGTVRKRPRPIEMRNRVPRTRSQASKKMPPEALDRRGPAPVTKLE